jgi:hypothetical protein
MIISYLNFTRIKNRNKTRKINSIRFCFDNNNNNNKRTLMIQIEVFKNKICH